MSIAMTSKLVNEAVQKLREFINTLITITTNESLGPYRHVPVKDGAPNNTPFGYTIVLLESDGRPFAWTSFRDAVLVFNMTQHKFAGLSEKSVRSVRAWADRCAYELAEKMGSRLTVEIWTVEAAQAYMDHFGDLCQQVTTELETLSA